MELILWRHAEAEDGKPDLARKLTPNGRQQAARMAAWLRRALPEQFRLIASPAARAQETAQALGVTLETAALIAPGATVAAILRAADWPAAQGTVIVVGHQPDLGRTAAFLACGVEAEWHIDKAALWWLESGAPVFVRAVTSPDLL
jgi:phosphohistidine phosphatase